ncbi:MAG: hypothetical protein FWC26_14940, partial [Fibromonadales bacterium]|nr:hypothetical protein [Fibromonadales bacterium]
MNIKQRKDYYGCDDIESLSYLEFGSVDLRNAKKTIWAYWQDQEAYDMYMFSRYVRDLFAFRDFVDKKEYNVEALNAIVLKSAHNKLMDYLFKYAGIITAVQFNAMDYICESGSSLYGWIDEAIACDNVFNNGEHIKGFKSLKYLGSDISDFMNKGAKVFYNEYQMDFSLAPTIADLMHEIKKFSLFYGLGVSMRYALRNADDMQAIAEKSELAIFNRLSVTMENETLRTIYGSGKSAYIISLPKLIESLNQNGISAKYCTSNMQWKKDGPNTLRASVVISKDIEKIEKFILNHDNCIDKCNDKMGG